jgi:hypothetical protein
MAEPVGTVPEAFATMGKIKANAARTVIFRVLEFISVSSPGKFSTCFVSLAEEEGAETRPEVQYFHIDDGAFFLYR